MPHLTLQYTENINQDIDFPDLFSKLHGILVDPGGIKIDNCKSRAIRLENYYIGRGEISNAFVHLDVQFLEGRSILLKKEIGNQMLDALKKYYKLSIAEFNLQITIEIRDIQREVYYKFPEGSI